MQHMLYAVFLTASADCKKNGAGSSAGTKNDAVVVHRTIGRTPTQIQGRVSGYLLSSVFGASTSSDISIDSSSVTTSIDGIDYNVLLTKTASVSAYFPGTGYPAGILHSIVAKHPYDGTRIILSVLQREAMFYACIVAINLVTEDLLQEEHARQALVHFSKPVANIDTTGCYDGKDSNTDQGLPRSNLTPIPTVLDQDVIAAGILGVRNTRWYPYSP